MTTNTQKDNNRGELFPETVENITLGAKVFKENASDIFNTFLEKVKDTAESAYEKGSQIYEDVALTAQGYVEKFKDRAEMARLKDRRDQVAKELGYMCFVEYSGRYRFRVEFMKSEEFRKLISQVRELDRQIIKLGNKLDVEALS